MKFEKSTLRPRPRDNFKIEKKNFEFRLNPWDIHI